MSKLNSYVDELREQERHSKGCSHHLMSKEDKQLFK